MDKIMTRYQKVQKIKGWRYFPYRGNILGGIYKEYYDNGILDLLSQEKSYPWTIDQSSRIIKHGFYIRFEYLNN
jgi:hypothetical protein